MSQISILNTVKVPCAIIEKDGKILCARRSEKMKHPLKWEFPGGKVEDSEDLQTCLKREIKEELGVELEILEQLPSNRHSYPGGKIIELIPFRCRLRTFDIVLKEHEQIQWLPVEQLKDLDWAEADVPIVKHYIEYKNEF